MSVAVKYKKRRCVPGDQRCMRSIYCSKRINLMLWISLRMYMALRVELQQSFQQRKSNGCCEAARGSLDEPTMIYHN